MKDLKTNPGVRVYSKAELASLYTPSLSPNSSRQTLIRWINRNKQLKKRLDAIGYDKRRHFFLSREVELIYKYLGMP